VIGGCGVCLGMFIAVGKGLSVAGGEMKAFAAEGR